MTLAGGRDTVEGAPMSIDDLRQVLRADFGRNRSSGQRFTLFIFRLGQFAHVSRAWWTPGVRFVWRALDLVYLRTLLGAEFPPKVRCGPGLALPHCGRGVVLHETVAIGHNSMLFHRVTIGTQGPPPAPRIGHDAVIGAGACVLGDIEIGDHVSIGANAVVTKDVPSWTTAVGVPARLVPRERA